MKQIISALFLCMLLSAVPGLQAQNIQLHYDFGRSLYDKDLQGRPLLTSTVEKFHPDTWGSTYFFVDMDYTSEGVAAAYWEIAREVKFWKGPFSAHLEYNGGLSKGMSYTSNPQPIGFRGNLLVKRQKFFYCTYSLGITETS